MVYFVLIKVNVVELRVYFLSTPVKFQLLIRQDSRANEERRSILQKVISGIVHLDVTTAAYTHMFII